MENLNFTIEAIEHLELIASNMKIAGDLNNTVVAFNWVVDMLKKSHKFILPEGGRIVEIEPTKIGTDIPLEFIKLPYPITAIEYRMTRGEVGSMGVPSNKRISLAFDLSKVEIPDFIKRKLSFLEEDGGMGVIAAEAVEAMQAARSLMDSVAFVAKEGDTKKPIGKIDAVLIKQTKV